MIVKLLINDTQFVQAVLDVNKNSSLNSLTTELIHDNKILKVDGRAYEVARLLVELSSWRNLDYIVL